jgi:Fungal specific transcription factor domain
VACSSCRDRRTRCVILTGESQCTQCKSNNQECLVKYDDERRKPNSKAYISSLTDRITHLENLLRESDRRDQQSSLPSTDNQQIDDNHLGNSDQPRHRATQEVAPDSHPYAPAQHDLLPPDTDLEAVSPQSSSSLGSASMVSKLLSTTGHLSFDQLSGRLRYFGPLANCHVHSELKSESEYAARQALEQQRRAEKAIRSISLDTHDYLMQLFWDCYNSVLHVIHQATFEEDRERGEGRFYSGFLHLCILAMGYRFADKTRADIVRISLPDKENTLQREAKYMLEYEIEQPGGIPSIVALLILGDLETGVGRDNLGWLYAGMANRLCFEIGLHLDTTNTGASAREIEIGRMTLWACIIYDKYWALFLGRPTMMKPADLEVYKLSQQFERLGTSLPAGPDKSRETQIYEALLDLMELAGKITEIMDQASKLNTNIDHHVYFRMSEIHRELETWYSRLPPSLQWNAGNIATSPFSFFLLHQQYSGAMILLHRPFARYDDPKAVQPGSGDSSEDDADTGKVSDPTTHFSALSRTICTQHAVRIARIFWQHRQRFDTRQIFVTGLQHAGTAATALVAALAFMKDRSTRNNNMQYLECIAAALQDMSHTYVPAEKMSNVLEAVILELRDAVPEKRTVPARRSSSHHDSQDRISTKRHQSFHHDPPPRIPEDDMAQRQQQSNTLFSTKSNDSQFSNLTATNGHGAATQRHDPIQAIQPDDWTFVGLHRTSSHPNDWPPLSHDLSSFDQPMSGHERSSSSSSNMHPSHLTQHTSTDFVPTTSTANSNFTQYRSSNAWMGAETPRTGFSPPPVGMQTPPFLHNQQSQRHQASQRAALHEIQDFTSTDFVSLLNPDDRLDFGNLGMPTGMNMGMGMGIGMNVNTTALNSSAIMRDLDGYPPLPTPKSNASGDGAGSVSSGDTADGRGDAEASSGVRQRRDGVNDPTRLKTMETMAGLADMMRRRG